MDNNQRLSLSLDYVVYYTEFYDIVRPVKLVRVSFDHGGGSIQGTTL
jgi:hypothetical protein